MLEKTVLQEIASGDIPAYIKEIALRERVELDRFLQSLLAGRTVVPSNRWVRKARPCAVGEGLAVKVNANLGTSLDYQDPRTSWPS